MNLQSCTSFFIRFAYFKTNQIHFITQMSNALYWLYDNPKKSNVLEKNNIKHVIMYLAYTDLHLIKNDPNEDRLRL